MTALSTGPVELVLSKLKSVQKKNESQWQACCPSHEDNRASLAIKRGEDGRCLLKCHAGCETGDVLAALGLQIRDLFVASDNGGQDNGNGKPRITETYDYCNEQRGVLYQSVRYEPKDFRQRSPDGNGGWNWTTKGVRRVVYRLPELLEADPVQPAFVPEGERDVDRLKSLGLVATCNVGGAKKWRKSDSEFLKDRHVKILPDNDDPGREHAQQVARSLKGIAKSVQIIELPDLPRKGDVSDWLDAGGTVDELMRLVETQTDKSSDSPNLWTAQGRTDSANARRLVAMHGDSIRWCNPWESWIAWDGKRWAKDNQRQIDIYAKRVAKSLFDEAGVALEKAEEHVIREMVRFAKSSSNAGGIRNMVSLARCEVPILPDKLDKHLWLFNCSNCTLDLKTGKQRPHNRTDFITQLCPIEYDPAAKCPTWERFLGQVFSGNEALIRFMQRAAGYSLTGSTRERCLFFPFGIGCNGKTTCVSTLQKMLGEYATTMTTEMLMDRRGQQHPTEICDLAGRRLAVGCELEDGRKFAEGLLKQLTGGEDRLKGRRMREDFWEFNAEFKLWISGNHKPRISGTDDGIWDRIRLIPFNVRFDQPDKTLASRLELELPGILAWCVRGCLEWQQHGLGEPEEVLAATAEYRSEMDALGAFLDDCCIVGDGHRERLKTLFDCHKRWAEENGERFLKQRRFAKSLRERGLESFTNDGVWFDGVELKAEWITE